MMAVARARHPAESVKALGLAVAVHLLVLGLLTANLRWTPSDLTQPVNVIKAVVITEEQARVKPAPVKERTDDTKRQQVEARRKAQVLQREKAERHKAALEQKRAAAERKRKAAQTRHRQEQKLLQEQLAAEEAERERSARLAAAQNKVAQYMTLIGVKISSKWRRPPGSAGDAFAIVRVRVTPGGRILGISVVRSSGDLLFDRAIENAIYLAEPLPVPDEPDVFELLREFNIDTEKLKN